jgi:hypothetical protein
MARGTLSNPFKQRGKTFGGGLLDMVTFGGAKDIRRQRAETEANLSQAQADVLAQQQAYENLQFQTFNPYEDMTVNLKAAEFQRQQQAQEHADVLAALQGGAGGAGSAALATSLMRASAQKQQQIAADIGKQEQAIEMAEAQAKIQQQQAKQQFEIGRMETMLGMDMAKVTGLQQAEQARKDRNAQLFGSVLGGITDIAAVGLTKGGFLNE